MNIFKKVEEFNRNLLNIRRYQPGLLKPEEAEWQIETLIEEINEFKDSLKLSNTVESIVGQADALMDLIYFAVGGFSRLGINSDQITQIFEAVHKANMTKVKGKKSERVLSIELDAVKPNDWVPPEKSIKKIIFGIENGNS